jgi:hypothetical protein
LLEVLVLCVVIEGDLGWVGGVAAVAADGRRGATSLPLWMPCILARFAFDWCSKELGGIGEKSLTEFFVFLRSACRVFVSICIPISPKFKNSF